VSAEALARTEVIGHEPHQLAPLRLGKFRFDAQGMHVEGNPTLEEWGAGMQALQTMERGIQFFVGDMINWGQERFGEHAAQWVDARDWKEETVRAYTWVAKKVAPEDRMLDAGVPFAHHMAVATLPPREQRRQLKRVADSLETENPISVGQLKADIKSGTDATPVSLWLTVSCKDQADLDQLKAAMEAQGRACKTSQGKG
jgi:hypothetical protein